MYSPNNHLFASMFRCKTLFTAIALVSLCSLAIADDTRDHSAAKPATHAGAQLRWQNEPSMTCSTSSNPIVLSSAIASQVAGFDYTTVQSAPLDRTIERNVQIAYNANRYARLSSRAPGVVTEVLKDLGEAISAGDVLAVVDSSELGTAKAELLQANETVKLWEANAKREHELLEKGVGIERELLEAETRLAEARISVIKARQRLKTLGLSDAQIENVSQDGDTSSLLSVTASFDGIVVDRTAVVGEVVQSGEPLLSIADTSVMWAMVDLATSDSLVVRVEQSATVLIDGLLGQTFQGTLTWISTQIDPKTRTLKARIELDNEDGLLKANMFGRAQIHAGDNRAALSVPKDAVQWEGCCNVAFVRTDVDGLHYQPVRLKLAFDAGDRYEVQSGLKAGDVVVTRGSFILKNEILKNSVGAGCCEVGHLSE